MLKKIIELLQKIQILAGMPKPGVFWVLTPPNFFGFTTPTFWRYLRMGAGEGVQQKLGGLEKNLEGKKIF